MSIQESICSKRGGENAASEVIQAIPEIEHVGDDVDVHIDARALAAIEADDLLQIADSLSIIESGTDLEIKSAMVVYGESQTRGRYYLREGQHEYLLGQDAVYLFAVCEPNPSRSIIAMKMVPAAEVDELVSSWIEAGDRPDYAQIAWSRIFDPEEIERGGRR
ncbi:hypothetical protein [Halostagnicola larsenii]|uniref:hypothetical protein n=1 Tax=Halostagnicola larsenii TaxID=353800 RepID=UPI0018D35C65|nr:hypothetical protein [Halostagnicola larsenii]